MKTVYRGLTMAATAIALCACAASPDSIKPHNISTQQYSYLTCPQLAEYKATLTAAYNKAADSENSARMEDAATSIVLGFPVGSMTHESVPWQVGDLKGRIIAVSQVQTANKCGQQREATAEQ
jgi:transposase